MSGETLDNVYIFPSPARTGREAGPSGHPGDAGTDDVGTQAERDPALDASDLRAMAECLQYLYHESNRLDAKTTSRLIGAAAMAVAEDIRDREG